MELFSIKIRCTFQLVSTVTAGPLFKMADCRLAHARLFGQLLLAHASCQTVLLDTQRQKRQHIAVCGIVRCSHNINISLFICKYSNNYPYIDI